ncbi:MAG TPA: YceD family protein [Bacillota bacterium]|nr:YceD family protein [Bacillota bacterium]
MKFTVGQIKRNAREESFPFEGKVQVNELETMNNDIRKIEPVHVEGMYSIQGEEIIFSFTICGKMILPCARTLVDVPYPFEINADEVFSLSPFYGKEEEENNIHRLDGEVIDLDPYIMENVALNIPFRVFTDDKEAYEQAIVKGDGWEFTSGTEEDETVDPRFEKLQSLFSDNENKE